MLDERLELVVTALKGAGYDSVAQIQGYLESGDRSYITRKGDARTLIGTIDRNILLEYVSQSRKLTLEEEYP